MPPFHQIIRIQTLTEFDANQICEAAPIADKKQFQWKEDFIILMNIY